MTLVLIEWNDPGFAGAHWENREPFSETSVHCVTCGILLHESKNDIQIIQSLNREFYSQGITFDKRIIKKMWKLRVDKPLVT